MTVSISGNMWHVYSPCPRCGYGTRFKQHPIRCLCNRDCSKAELQKWSRFAHQEANNLSGKRESVRPSSGLPSGSMHLRQVPIAVIAAWLGHASAAFTMSVYAHSQDDALKAAASSFGRVVTFCDTETGSRGVMPSTRTASDQAF